MVRVGLPALALLLCVPPVSSRAETQTDLVIAERRRWLEQLDQPKRRWSAIRGLAGVGDAIVPLLESQFASEPDRRVWLAHVCERLGKDAIPLLARLEEAADSRDRELEAAAFAAIGAVASHAVAPDDWIQRLRNTRARSLEGSIERNIASARIRLGAGPRDPVLIDALEKADYASIAAAFRVVRQMGTELRLPVRVALLQAFRRVSAKRSRLGGAFHRLVLDGARAIVACVPDAADATVARGYLLGSEDPVEKIAAARALRDAEEYVPRALPQLLAALGSSDPVLVREVMVTLSLLGDRAMDAIPLLEQKTRSDVREHRVLARRTVDAIHRRMSPEARVVSRFLWAPEDDLEQLLPIIERLGPVAIDAIVASLQARRRTPEQVRKATSILAELGSAAGDLLPLLVEDIRHVDAELAGRILAVIGMLGPEAKRIYPQLEVRLKTSIVRARLHVMAVAAWRALARVNLPDSVGVERLGEALTDPNPVLRLHAAERLAALGRHARDAARALCRAMDDVHPDICKISCPDPHRERLSVQQYVDLDAAIQVAAATALLMTRPDRESALAANACLLEHGSSAQKLAAIRALERAHVVGIALDRRIGEWIELATVDDDKRVVSAAQRALARIR